MGSSLSIVYVLTNSAMPGLVKIGYTSQDDANSRIAQLYTTGVPVPFTIEYACKVQNAEEVEKVCTSPLARTGSIRSANSSASNPTRQSPS